MDFFTLSKPTKGLYREKGSKFYSFAFPVATEEEVKERLEILKKEYHDARHHCYAYHLGMENPEHRANDDGEPNHSAGDPILGQIRSFNLTNVLVVVIRYFGGTKLGVGGLINAYKSAAEDALKKSDRKVIFPVMKFEIIFEYDQTAEVERFLHNKEVEITGRTFEASCRLTGRVRKNAFAQFMIEAEQARITVNKLES